ncbi:MAG: hypothetical protein JO359_00550 [Candidatus Eremiobacteraeota bacterium]|nr:hypothetical protein [Candidatus Eremiobacteraeota bacterium]
MQIVLFRIPLAVLLMLVLTSPLGAEYVGRSPAELGKVTFPTSCNASVGDTFARGVALLHSFWWSEGESTFKAVLAQDPSCAIAAWGLASIYMNNPFGTPPASRPADALAALDLARRSPAKTQRERDYVEAAAVYYDDFSTKPEPARALARAKAYEALVAKYPSDEEAKIFYALYLAASQPLSDQTYASRIKAASILEGLLPTHPEHPGVAHYLIHCYDEPPYASKGLPSANRYAGIAPAAPHALHMPSHIYTRLGSWTESIATNRRATIAAKQGNEPGETLHTMDYTVYAALQLARDNDARAIVAAAPDVDISKLTGPGAPYARAAMPARFAVERGAWTEAAKLDVTSSRFPYTEAMTRFARALGAVRGGTAASAAPELARIVELRDTLTAAGNAYWASEVEVMRLSSAAWIALSEKRNDEAAALMRQAAETEDRNEKASVTPGRILPARELLGDLLLALDRPADALREYEMSQIREPNRFRGLNGSAMAAARAGDRAKAKGYYERLVAMAGAGDPRPEIASAKAYLALR